MSLSVYYRLVQSDSMLHRAESMSADWCGYMYHKTSDKQLKHNGIDYHVGPLYAGAFGYADDEALVAPSLYSLKCMIATCEEFVKKHQITFNPTKSKLLCFNACEHRI